MKQRLLLALLLLAVIPAHGQDLLSRLIPQKMNRPAGEGLLLVSLDASHTEPLELEFAQADGSSVGSTTVRAGSTSILALPAGRYCLRSVRRAKRVHQAKCAQPYVDVTGGSIDFTGALRLLLRGKRARVLDRSVPNDVLSLDAAQMERVDAFLAHGADGGVRTLFRSSPAMFPDILRLYADGMAELETYAIYNASYLRWRWSGDEQQIVIEHEGGRYDLTATPGGWRGVQTDGGGAAMSRSLRGHEVFAAASDLRCWRWSACGSRIGSEMVVSPDYTWVKGNDELSGRVTLEFALEKRFAASRPRDVRVVSSTLAEALEAQVVEQFVDARFTPELVGARRRRMEIEFLPSASGVEVVHGPLLK
jgi:hypothetical protein